MTSDIVAAWHRSADITDMLLEAVSEPGLEARYSARTRTVASQFAHLHNVRLSHVERRGTGSDNTPSFPRGAQPTQAELRAALAASREQVAALLASCETAGKVKSWKGTPTSYLSYFVAHEAHHRGLVLVSLRLSGVKIDKDIGYGIWGAWGKA